MTVGTTWFLLADLNGKPLLRLRGSDQLGRLAALLLPFQEALAGRTETDLTGVWYELRARNGKGCIALPCGRDVLLAPENVDELASWFGHLYPPQAGGPHPLAAGHASSIDLEGGGAIALLFRDYGPSPVRLGLSPGEAAALRDNLLGLAAAGAGAGEWSLRLDGGELTFAPGEFGHYDRIRFAPTGLPARREWAVSVTKVASVCLAAGLQRLRADHDAPFYTFE